MKNYQEDYATWDAFLAEWPISRLETMTLDEYILSGDQNTFTYWIESKLDRLGSIWGGSAFKFGVFSRANSDEEKTDNNKRSYSDTHGWYTEFGNTAEEAFEKVKSYVLTVAGLASKGDLDAIEAFPHLGTAYKWKIAFHYQNRNKPQIVNVFKHEALAAFIGSPANKTMANLQRKALEQNTENLGVLEFGALVWEVWSKKKITIWKMSHGSSTFTAEQRQQLLKDKKITIYKDTGKNQGHYFIEAPIGSLFYLCHGNSLQLIGRITSAATPNKDDEGWVERSYEIIAQAVSHERYTHNSKYWSPQGNSTFYKVKPADLPEFEETLLKPFFNMDLLTLASYTAEHPVNTTDIDEEDEQEQVASEIMTNHCFNRIYYGPPGTGKTYKLMQLLKNYEQKVETATLEQLQTEFINKEIAPLPWWQVIFLALYDLGGENISVKQVLEHPYMRALVARSASKDVRAAIWANLQIHTIENSTTVNYKNRTAPAVFDKNTDSTWKLAGEWKEACEALVELSERYKQLANKSAASMEPIKRYRFVTFHQSYGYEEFVEGLRPILNDGQENSGDVAYEIRKGVFRELCDEAKSDPTNRYAMVIDEINRGNISKIFGELITLIEPDKRQGSESSVTVKLPYSGSDFSVPSNIDIIGTMNTADRSLALLDTALRRRFEFVPLLPDTRDEEGAPLAGLQVKTEQSEDINICLLLEKINQRIEVLYDRDHCIGHSYFIELKNIESSERFDYLAKIFKEKIIPLLEEYFFEDWHKIRLVLADNQKPRGARFIERVDLDDELESLFGDHELNMHSVKPRYQLVDEAFNNPESYLGIYTHVVTED